MFSTWQIRFLLGGLLIVSFTLYELHSSSTKVFKWAKQTSPSPIGSAESPGIARYLSPAELMSRPLSGSSTAITKIIHQSWKTAELPAKFAHWSETCRKQHPDWEWVLWTDEDNHALMEKFVPGMKDIYDGLPSPIFRADMVRNAYLYLFGGLYMDLDMECLRPTDEIFDKFGTPISGGTSQGHSNLAIKVLKPFMGSHQKVFVGKMGTDVNFEHNIPNAWMASPPGHPLFKLMLQWAAAKIMSGADISDRPELVTGPVALRDGIQKFQKGLSAMDVLALPDILSKDVKAAYPDKQEAELVKNAKVETLPFYYIYPYSWHRDGDMFREMCQGIAETFNPERCKAVLAVDQWPSYTVTYWSHTWHNWGAADENIAKLGEAKG